MRPIHAVLVFVALSLFACASHDPSPPPTSSTVQLPDVPKIGSTQQELTVGFCTTHLVACQHACTAHPVLCNRLCDAHPHLPFCAPACGTDDAPCSDDGDCCAGLECIDNNGNGHICNEVHADAGTPPPCTQIGDECDPNGAPCCSPGGGDPPGVCEQSDPSDPNATFVCDPAP